MGLSELKPFNPEEKIIEYILRDKSKKKLVDMSLASFVWETSADSPAPGGGSVAAAMGALGAALGTMVANLSGHKRGWDDRWEEFAAWAEQGVIMQKRLLQLVDEDTEAYNNILKAFELPKKTDEEKTTRSAAVEAATLQASLVPLTVMKESLKVFDLLKEMTEKGNPNSVTDGAVGVLAVRACIRGAFLNVKINVKGLKDREKAAGLVAEAQVIDDAASILENEIIARVSLQLAI